jgi:hypothetical protein
MYKLIDYNNGRQVTDELYGTEADAHEAREEYLRYKLKSGEIHNNLLLIVKA